MNTSEIRPGLMVHVQGASRMNGVPGEHVGTVDHLEGDDYIKLKKTDSPDGRHRWVPVDWVERVDGKAVYLKCSKEEFENRVSRTPPSREQVA